MHLVHSSSLFSSTLCPAWSLTHIPKGPGTWGGGSGWGAAQEEGGIKYEGTICLTAGGGQRRGPVSHSPQDGMCRKGKALLPRTEIKSLGSKRTEGSDSFPDLWGLRGTLLPWDQQGL